jgi:hypothetical protein
MRLHARQVMTRQAHAAHEVDLDHPLPLIVRDLLERVRLEDAEIVDQDRDLGEAGQRQLRAPNGAEVGGQRLEVAAGWAAAMAAIASATRASVRPLTITRAPSAASVLATARPMPAVEPVTRASLPAICRSMAFPPGGRDAAAFGAPAGHLTSTDLAVT